MSTGKENFYFKTTQSVLSVRIKGAVQWQRNKRGYMPMQQFRRHLKWLKKLSDTCILTGFFFFFFLLTILRQLTSSYAESRKSTFFLENVLKLWCSTLKGDLAEGTCISFHHHAMHACKWSILAMFFVVLLIVSWKKSSKRLGFCLFKINISLTVHWPLS